MGAHFFSPAHIMPLLEIVRTRFTSPQVSQSSAQPPLQCVLQLVVQQPQSYGMAPHHGLVARANSWGYRAARRPTGQL